MTRKIGISPRDDLHEWASGEAGEGRAEPVPALTAGGWRIPGARSRPKALAADPRAGIGEPDEERIARPGEALRAAGEAYRRHFRTRAGRAA